MRCFLVRDFAEPANMRCYGLGSRDFCQHGRRDAWLIIQDLKLLLSERWFMHRSVYAFSRMLCLGVAFLPACLRLSLPVRLGVSRV